MANLAIYISLLITPLLNTFPMSKLQQADKTVKLDLKVIVQSSKFSTTTLLPLNMGTEIQCYH